MLGGLNEKGPHRFIGYSIIKGCGFVGVSVALLEKVCQGALKFQMLKPGPSTDSLCFFFSVDFCNHRSHATVLHSFPVMINYLQDTQGKQHLQFLMKISLGTFFGSHLHK